MNRLPFRVTADLIAAINMRMADAKSMQDVEHLVADYIQVFNEMLEPGDELDAWLEWIARLPTRWADREMLRIEEERRAVKRESLLSRMFAAAFGGSR